MKRKPSLYTQRQVELFAWMPTKVESKWIWMKPYLAKQVYMPQFLSLEEKDYRGIMTQKALEYTDWETLEKRLI